MRERDIETYLRKQVKAAGGLAYKWTSPGNAGVPDRIVVLPFNRVHFVELKAPGQKPTPLQLAQHRELTARGCSVWVIDSKEGVDAFLQEARS
ncbi:VRR-NUC domain-containing protein [Paenibacillus ihuae]|uniref:VRR-NUC domain-containing protein n=1 Tax=Paenibacillus ihuae TaxID=1232431 RepID=UPI0006D5A242|nr:VRR-NUC domain-containing protein [Paenibacillus ihuae]